MREGFLDTLQMVFDWWSFVVAVYYLKSHRDGGTEGPTEGPSLIYTKTHFQNFTKPLFSECETDWMMVRRNESGK